MLGLSQALLVRVRELQLNSFENNINGFIQHSFALTADETQEVILGSGEVEENKDYTLVNTMSIRNASGVNFTLRVRFHYARKKPTWVDHTLALNGAAQQIVHKGKFPKGARSVELSVLAHNGTGDVKDVQLRLNNPSIIRWEP